MVMERIEIERNLLAKIGEAVDVLIGGVELVVGLFDLQQHGNP